MLAAAAQQWQWMWDGVLFTTFNYQGGRRGDNDVRAQNWLMLMGSRQVGRGTLALNAMTSLEPVTVGAAGYSHSFQLGDTYNNLPVTHRQHPHDLFMQLEAEWRVPFGKTEFSISGGPRRRAGVWSDGVSPSTVGVRESERTPDASHVRLNSRGDGIRDGRTQTRPVHARRVCLSRARAG